MKIKNLEVSDTRHEIICNGFFISEIETFEELVNTYDEYAQKFPKCALLVSLDNLGQALYTSMHASMFHDLDESNDQEMSAIDWPADVSQAMGHLSVSAEYFVREENFKAKLKGVSFLDACAKGLKLQDEELSLLESIHADPKMVLDNNAIMWVVPVQNPSLALCACPNGYFSCDLNPFESYALATYLNEKYAYRLFGIGASCIGFRRSHSLEENIAVKLGHDIARLYNCDENADTVERISRIAASGKYLFLKYGEDIQL